MTGGLLRRLSIRARIAIGSTAIVVVLVLAAGVAVYAQISSIAVSREKAVLHGIAEVYRGIILEDPEEPFEKPGVDQHVAVISPEGTVKMDTLPPKLTTHMDELTEPGPALRELHYGETYYVYVDVVDTPQGAWKVLVTRDSDIAAGIVTGVSRLLWALFIAAAVLFAVGSWVIATAALRPVERLRSSAERLALYRDQHELLPVRGTGDEIDALARTLNRLIEDVRAASAREQQMVADASHELRNPMAVLRAQLELVDGSDPDADRTLLAQARTTLNRLIRLAQTMLELSRIEADSAPEATSLQALADEVTERVDRARWHLAEPSSELRGEIDLDIRLAAPRATARLDAAGIGHVVDNLVDNALRAGRGRPVRVRVTLAQDDAQLELLVADDGPGFDPGVADRAFERFTRGEASDYAGGGLGLAIVARVAELAGGAATISSAASSGAEVGIRVPVGSGSDDAERPSPNTHHR